MAKTIKKFQSPNKNYVIKLKNDKSIKKDSKGKSRKDKSKKGNKTKKGSKGNKTRKGSKGKKLQKSNKSEKKSKKSQKKKSKVVGKDDYAIYVNSVEIEITNNTFSQDDIDEIKTKLSEFKIYDITVYNSTNLLDSLALLIKELPQYVLKIFINNLPDEIPKGIFTDRENIQELILNAKFTSIGEEAFKNCKNLTSIQCHNDYNEIKKSAFENCQKLPYFNFPKSLVSIGTRAFFACYKLECLNSPTNLSEIGEEAFSECTELQSLIFDINISNIAKNAFYNVNGSTFDYLRLPNLQAIPDELFKDAQIDHISTYEYNEENINKIVSITGNPNWKECFTKDTVNIGKNYGGWCGLVLEVDNIYNKLLLDDESNELYKSLFKNVYFKSNIIGNEILKFNLYYYYHNKYENIISVTVEIDENNSLYIGNFFYSIHSPTKRWQKSVKSNLSDSSQVSMSGKTVEESVNISWWGFSIVIYLINNHINNKQINNKKLSNIENITLHDGHKNSYKESITQDKTYIKKLLKTCAFNMEDIKNYQKKPYSWYALWGFGQEEDLSIIGVDKLQEKLDKCLKDKSINKFAQSDSKWKIIQKHLNSIIEKGRLETIKEE